MKEKRYQAQIQLLEKPEIKIMEVSGRQRGSGRLGLQRVASSLRVPMVGCVRKSLRDPKMQIRFLDLSILPHVSKWVKFVSKGS